MADVLEGRVGEPPGRPDDPATGPSRPDAGAGGTGAAGRFRAAVSHPSPESLITLACVAGLVIYTLAQLHPRLMIRDTTPTGGDMGAHVWGPAFLRDHLLPNFKLSGWAPDWYLGFPAYHYYMVIPALAVVAVDVLLPYGTALKLVSAAGIATLPIAAWALGRLGGLRFPFPPLLAAGATLFLFDEHFTIYGGNIASTMAGEFSFSIALSLALLYLGVLAHGLRTGRHRALCAALLAVCALCHLIVSFFALAGTAVLLLQYFDRHRLRYVVSFGLVTGLLVAFWMLPFWWRRAYMTDMEYERRVDWAEMFFPHQSGADLLVMGLAAVGLVGALVHGRRMGVFLAIMALGYGIWARVWPQGHLWNARLLPFMYLSRYLLVMMGLGELGLLAASAWSRRAGVFRAAVAAVPAVVAVVVCGIVGMGIRNLPGGTTTVETVDGTTTWVYHWGPFSSTRAAVVDDWAKWNYSGYESKATYGEYRGVVAEMDAIGRREGCGRALWENNNATNQYGTPMALMLLPFWTDGCIASSEGLFFEASATTPYHFLAAAALSGESSNPVRNMPYVNADVDRGVTYLQRMGIRYYLAFTPSVLAQADAHEDLVPVGGSGPWKVYRVLGSELVEGLALEPAVVEGVGDSRSEWLDVGVGAFTDLDPDAVPLAASGPEGWARVEPGQAPPPRPLEPVTVSDIDAGVDTISFRVDRPGVPVVVKASYFPNWQVDGAEGPYRLAPNLMVVVPTDEEVRLHYGRTPVGMVSYGMTGLGLVGLVLLWRSGPVAMPPKPERARRPAGAPRPPRGPGPGVVADWDEPAEERPDDDPVDEDLWEQLSRALGVGPPPAGTDLPPGPPPDPSPDPPPGPDPRPGPPGRSDLPPPQGPDRGGPII